MNEIDIPDFKKQKKGNGAIKNFIKKHKTKIEVASGLAALSLPFLTYLAMRNNAKENKPLTEAQVMALPQREREIKEEQKMSGYPSGFPPPRAPREIPPPPKRHLGFFVVPPEIRSPVPQAIPLKPEHKAFLEAKKGRGKPNKLAKQVMEYKKKHNITLKEAWAHFK